LRLEWQSQLEYQGQEMLFWESETKVRVRSVGPTAYERHQLENMVVPREFTSKIKKILNHFGNPNGTWNTTKALVTYFRQHECRNYARGQMVPVSSAMFTVFKHMLVSNWALLWPEFKDLRKEVKQPQEGIFCDCLPCTALMPFLCIHSKVSQQQMCNGNGPMHIMDTLCPTCSKCWRCDKFLGCRVIHFKIQEFWAVSMSKIKGSMCQI